MRTDFYFPSHGAGQIHGCRWMPETPPKGIVQIVHGISEFVERYDEFANSLTASGFAVVAEDHMGHGQSIGPECPKGYFAGGWFTAVEDTMQLMNDTMAQFPGVPYILFGHSMGSFMARTILAKYPNSGIAGAIICGTGWQPRAALPLLSPVIDGICKKHGESTPVPALHKMIFGSYNNRIKNPRTDFDWLTRDDAIVDAYIAHPLCGFVPACGLLRDMLRGIAYIEQPKNLDNMKKHLPVLFIAGQEDPVGPYGKGVEHTQKVFQKAGMVRTEIKIYPGCRHEILNEINRQEVFQDVLTWLQRL